MPPLGDITNNVIGDLPAAKPQLQEERAEKRYAKNGELYTFQDFVDYYGDDRGPILWDYALPQDLNEATEKCLCIMESYENMTYTLGISPVALFARGNPRERCQEETPPPAGAQGSCSECGRAPGEHAGCNRFEGQSYCSRCWDAWFEDEQRIWTEWAALEEGPTRSSAASDEASPDHKRVRSALASEEPWRDWRGPIRVAAEATDMEVEPAIGVPFLGKPLRWRRHFDFIEIGTSDWGTLTQYCAGEYNTHVSTLAAGIRTSIDGLTWARGLAVEPVREHLEALPVLPRVAKVEAAMGEVSGDLSLFFVSPENVAHYMSQFRVHLPWEEETGEIVDWNEVDVMWYAKSLSCVGRPHPDLLAMLREVGREDLLEERQVRVLNWSDLCFQHGVGSVDIVQVDCEGMDCAILRGMLRHCDEHPGSMPRLIQFEANHLTDADEVEATVSALEQRGYWVRSRTWSNITVER